VDTPLTVTLETIADTVYAYCPELDLNASADEEQAAVENLAEAIVDYWTVLLKDPSLRERSPHKEHYELFVKKVIPYIYQMNQKEPEAEVPVGFRKRVADIISCNPRP